MNSVTDQTSLMSGAEAACSVRGSHFDRLNAPPSDWRNESDLSDFHALRQEFIPPKPGG